MTQTATSPAPAGPAPLSRQRILIIIFNLNARQCTKGDEGSRISKSISEKDSASIIQLKHFTRSDTFR